MPRTGLRPALPRPSLPLRRQLLRATGALAIFRRLGAVVVPLLCAASAWASNPAPELRWGTVHWSGETATGKLTSGETAPIGLDRELQDEMHALLVRAKPIAGAATLVDAQSGQVLAAAEIGSSPGSLLFDPIAPAASVFKIVTTATLYERTSVTPLTRVCTSGGLRGIERSHLSPAHGSDAVCAPFAHALGVSRNAAYAQLATRELLRNDLLEMAEDLGFNRSLSLDTAGRVGTVELPYNDLEFARAAAGFSGSRLSVFGGAQLAMTIASGGLERPMHFVASEARPPVEEQRVLSSRTARRLRNAMEVTIHSGTARESFVKRNGRGRLGPIQVAGKTGTLKPDADSPTASWFVGFAPSEEPMVVVSVVLQNPDRWYQKGHQVARDILQGYFARHGVRGLSPPL